MDILVQREALLKPLQAISGVVEKKQTTPILSNVLLSTKDGKLLLTGTDGEIELVGFVPLDALTEEGSTTVSARKLFDICRTLPDGMALRLTLEKNCLIVRAGESCFTLNILPAQDFPNLADEIYPVEFRLKQYLMKNILTKTSFAMGQQDVRHYLNGAYLDIQTNSIKCVAADGHRLALTSINDTSIGEQQTRFILPRKSVLELMRLLSSDEADEASLHIAENRFRMVTNEFIFTTKLINAQYPDYSRLIPKGTLIATSDRDLIKHALTRASILSNEKFRGVRFQLESSKLRITANNSDQEQAEEAVPLEYSGNPIEIGFNVAYLLDVLSTISTKAIRWAFTDASNGVLIEPMGDEGSLYVIMPMRL